RRPAPACNARAFTPGRFPRLTKASGLLPTFVDEQGNELRRDEQTVLKVRGGGVRRWRQEFVVGRRKVDDPPVRAATDSLTAVTAGIAERPGEIAKFEGQQLQRISCAEDAQVICSCIAHSLPSSIEVRVVYRRTRAWG